MLGVKNLIDNKSLEMLNNHFHESVFNQIESRLMVKKNRNNLAKRNCNNYFGPSVNESCPNRALYTDRH